MLSSFTSADFTQQGKYVVSRDFLTVKLWDVCNTKKPVISISVNDGFKSKLSEMFENDAQEDQFIVRASPDGKTFASGSYNNWLHLMDQDGSNSQFELSYKKNTVCRQITGKGTPLGKVDYLKKTTSLDYHPTKNTVAVASLNCFFTYGM
jgi:serine/threonine-protein phosphatase 2A regulatory subunit B